MRRTMLAVLAAIICGCGSSSSGTVNPAPGPTAIVPIARIFTLQGNITLATGAVNQADRVWVLLSDSLGNPLRLNQFPVSNGAASYNFQQVVVGNYTLSALPTLGSANDDHSSVASPIAVTNNTSGATFEADMSLPLATGSGSVNATSTANPASASSGNSVSFQLTFQVSGTANPLRSAIPCYLTGAGSDYIFNQATAAQSSATTASASFTVDDSWTLNQSTSATFFLIGNDGRSAVSRTQASRI